MRPRLVWHTGCSYTSPPQPERQALALIRALLNCTQATLAASDSTWAAPDRRRPADHPPAPRQRRRPTHHQQPRLIRGLTRHVAHPRQGSVPHPGEPGQSLTSHEHPEAWAARLPTALRGPVIIARVEAPAAA